MGYILACVVCRVGGVSDGVPQNVSDLFPCFMVHFLSVLCVLSLSRMAKMPPGDDREFLRLIGLVRQMSCSHTVVQVRPAMDIESELSRTEPNRTDLNIACVPIIRIFSPSDVSKRSHSFLVLIRVSASGFRHDLIRLTLVFVTT